MYRRGLNAAFVAVLFLIASSRADAQGGKFFVDASLGYVFDNHEFDASGGAVLPSQTFHFVRVSPEIGWRFSPEGGWNSRLVLGVDLVKQAGSKIETLSGALADVPFYYLTSYETGRGHFVGAVGSFPRTFVTGSYSELMMSEETVQSDFNLDGMYLGYRRDNFFNEIALDWLGRRGNFRRERFQILVAGNWKLSPELSLGWSGSFYHYAGSNHTPGVVDNHHLNLYTVFKLPHGTALDELSLKLGVLASYQNDRVNDDFRAPYGGEAELTLRKSSFGVKNLSALTTDFLPFYDRLDASGFVYGSELYRGSRFYSGGFYDRLEFFWAPRPLGSLRVRVSCRLHFNSSEGFLGWEQRACLLYNF